MNTIRLAGDGPSVSALGYGLMSLSQTYGPSEDDESIAAIEAALEVGIDFLDTAEIYGMGHNERLFARVLEKKRGSCFVATKFGLELGDQGMRANGRPENVRRAIEGSLGRLGIETIDLYYLHRRDPDVPIEETVGTMSRLVEEGKVERLGLSEVTSETLRRAHAEHPIAALQSEYSVFHREPESDVLPICRELGTTFVAFSPLGRGLLTGSVQGAESLHERDMRRHSPQLSEANWSANAAVVESFVTLAREIECEPAQLALAWLLHRGVLPLFGTRRAERIRENIRALEVAEDLAANEALLSRIEEVAPPGAIKGAGTPAPMESLKERNQLPSSSTP